MDGAVKVVEEIGPAIKDRRLVLVLAQLVVDVLELDRFCVVIAGNTADAVREHPLERDGLLGGAGCAVVLPGLLNDFPDLLLLRLCEACGERDGRRFPAAVFLLLEQ